MGVATFLRRLDRVTARFNRWLEPAALASNAETGNPGPGSVDAARITAILGEIEQSGATAQDEEESD
jgi:hypothetical protein